MGKSEINKISKKALIATSLSVLFLFLSFAYAELSKSYVICKNQKEVRTIRIESAGGGKCQTVYTKQGKDQVVGSGLNPMSCEDFLSTVRKKIEDANWKCRDVKDTAVSTLADDPQ